MKIRWLSLTVPLLLSGCGCDSAPPKKTIGVTLLTQTHDFYKDLEEGLKAEAAAKGFKLEIASGEMDPARQAAQIEDFVARRVDAILVCPCDSTAVGRPLAAAEKAGIPAFTADISARSGRIVSHIASDNVQGGKLAAQAMAKFLGSAGGKVLVIDHPVVASVQERVRGFEEEIGKHPGISIVGKPTSDGQRAKAVAVTEDMLQAHPDLAGIFGINDDSALGALSAAEAAGRKEIVIIGYDATPEARKAIARGSGLKADVIQQPRTIGKTAIDIISRHFAGEKVPPVVPVEVGIADAGTLGK